MIRSERKTLSEEARYFHLRIFGLPPAGDLVDAYVRAHADIPDLGTIDERELRTVQIIVAHRLDAVGIEPLLRGKGRRHALSAKLLLLAYLAECDARHPEFMRCATNGPKALVSMGSAALMVVFRLLRGHVQKAWHGLV